VQTTRNGDRNRVWRTRPTTGAHDGCSGIIGDAGRDLLELHSIVAAQARLPVRRRRATLSTYWPAQSAPTITNSGAPSAGALYAAELYVAVRDVEGLDAGIYHYEVPVNQLALLRGGDVSVRLADVCCGQEYPLNAAVTVLISGVVGRSTRKYGERGYRYVLLDVGHLGQNLYLSCAALGLSITTTCGFFDDDAADMLGVDGSDEPVLYFGFIGRPVPADG
jgi:SagB-type dehydrogenase family enzyme